MEREAFKNPDKKYRMKTILHTWPADCEVLADAVKEFGYGGVATNPPTENGYTANADNLKTFSRILKAVRDRGMDYWIYDEQGYPSGHAGGQALEGHPELEAKGFYMRRRITYEPRHTVFELDDESDKIIWAARYPMDCSQMNASVILYEQMEKVPFTEKFCECDLKENEALFIFCVKSAYEGSHLTHNVSSKRRYINIMDERAVRRFLDVGYEPIAGEFPEAYPGAEAVFTDEPSLQVAYMHGDESWPYALAPWTEGLFEKFEEEYGYSLLPYLPQIFEGGKNTYNTRVRFYELVGKMIAQAYVKQIAEWCRAHGTCFSGHYLAEETMMAHVLYYGSYMEVLKAAGYPGVDVLASYPGIYHHNTTKFAQMASRKNRMNGIMVELCPFINMEHFSKMPVQYSAGILSLLYAGGCRCVNSYFRSDFSSYAPDKLGTDYGGFMSREQSVWLNEYVGRMGMVLDGAHNDCGTFVYYAVEDVQAKTKPGHTALESVDSPADVSLLDITRNLYREGYDYLMADKEDLVMAADSLLAGDAKISGCLVKNVIIPAIDVIYSETWEALIRLKEAGVNIWFADKLPGYKVGEEIPFVYYDFREECILDTTYVTDGKYFRAACPQEIMQYIKSQEKQFEVFAQTGEKLLVTRYRRGESVIYFVVNRSEKEQTVMWRCGGDKCTQVWNPADGTVAEKKVGENVKMDVYCGIFFVFKQD